MKKSKKRSSRSKVSRKASSRAPKAPAKKPTLPFDFKDVMSLAEFSKEDILSVIKLAERMKKDPGAFLNKLKGKSIILLFQKPSMRTRVSFQVGIEQLGGSAVYMGPDDLPMGERESIKDVARVVSRYCDAVVMRTFSQNDIAEFAKHATIPVINGLSDAYHPCQILADLLTVKEKFKTLDKMNFAYIGDGNNVLSSLLYGVSKIGAHLSIATPKGYEPSEEILKDIKLIAKETGSKISLSNNPFTALKNAHAIYTDVWVSMGQERQTEQRLRDFQPFQVNMALISKAPKDAVIMHCLPAHRGQEITEEVIEHPRAVIFDQAENRLHAQKALLYFLLTKKKKK